MADNKFSRTIRRNVGLVGLPQHWKEPYYSGKAGSPKYDKIAELVNGINKARADLDEGALGSLPAHASSHQDGGSDEINVGGLAGDLADPQDPKTHATSHNSGGGDQISAVFLAGDQSVAGVKTFSSFPVTPSSYPSTSYQVSNKLYADYLAQFPRSLFPSQTDYSTGSNPTSYACHLNPFNSYWSIYYVGTPNSYHRVMLVGLGTGPYTFWWMVNASYGTAGTAMGFSIQFKMPVSTSYTADIYLNGSPNSGSYWYYRVYLDSTQKYSGQPSGYNVLNVSLGSLTAGTTYYFKQELYNAITCGPHTGTFYIQAVVIRPT